MKEVTRITTLEITEIQSVSGTEPYNMESSDFQRFADAMRDTLGVDNVDVANVQYFEREVESHEE